jgi:ankyrin repeat protein
MKSMLTILTDNYLAIYLLSFLDISNTIYLMRTSQICHKLIITTIRYRKLQKCKPKLNVKSICKQTDLDILQWYILSHNIHSMTEPLVWGTRYGNFDIMHYAVHCGAKKDSALRCCALNGYLEMVKYWQRQGANIHAWNDDALVCASIAGQLVIVKYLIEQGCNIHIQNGYALLLSARQGHLEIVQYLVEYGANISDNNITALNNAAFNGHLAIVQYLVEHGSQFG